MYNKQKLIELGKNLGSEILSLLKDINQDYNEYNIYIIENKDSYSLEIKETLGDDDTGFAVFVPMEQLFYDEDFMYSELYTELAWSIFQNL